MTDTIVAANENRVLNVLPDPPDIRDRVYEPGLLALDLRIAPSRSRVALDQGAEGACTGFGLAAVIDQLLRRQERAEQGASARMLYEMAKRHDEWPGHGYDGSSCRGAIRGWKNMGVCSAEGWPHIAGEPGGGLTVERAIEARRITLGAYYRLRPDVVDYHAALNEVGAVYCSASVHSGWKAPEVRGSGSRRTAIIEAASDSLGGHAFAIIGYDEDGFWVQNSWGPAWGVNGVALWPYADWLENVTDGWVVQLALPTPAIFGRSHGARRAPSGELSEPGEREELFGRPAPKRLEIAGHFVHFDDGSFKSSGDYWSTLSDIEQTADRLAASDNYDKLLVYAHGGLNSPKASARRIRGLKDGFKRNRIYPFHMMYDTGLCEEIKDIVSRGGHSVEGRAGGFTDWTDNLIEAAVRKPGTAIWEEMKRDAELPFAQGGDGARTIAAFATRLAVTSKDVHMAGHSTGAILLGHLLNALERMEIGVRVKTLTLFAPACRVDFFREKYLHFLNRSAEHVRVDKLTVYNLEDELERDDQVGYVYRKSLLYLVSRAFERADDVPLLGMSKYSKRLHRTASSQFIYSKGEGGFSESESHGGFDNDLTTMNHLLRRLGGTGVSKFTEDEMRGY